MSLKLRVFPDPERCRVISEEKLMDIEFCLHTAGVTGSIPVTPTILYLTRRTAPRMTR